MTSQVLNTLKNSIKHWYIPLIVGIIFILIGILTFSKPVEAFETLAVIFSVSFIFIGLIEIIFSISNRNELENWGWLLVFGILTLAIGVLLVSKPELSNITLPLYVGFVVLFRSILSISLSLDLKDYGVLDWGFLLLLGVLGILFSFILLWNPIFAGLTIVFWTASSLILIGIFSIYLSFKLKSIGDKIPDSVKDGVEKIEEFGEKVKKEIKNSLDN